jgi:hypothetical protein
VSKHHDLKCWPYYFQEVISGNKTFEVRVNDREFEEGDTLRLKEYNPNEKIYTGKTSDFYTIGYVLDLDKYTGSNTNHVVLSLLKESV